MYPEDILKQWPGAVLPDEAVRSTRSGAKRHITLVQYVGLTDNGEYEYCVIAGKSKHLVFKSVEPDSPIEIERWSKVSGEVYGRGPITNALPDVRTCNKLVEMILQNASLAIAGVYTAVDDGVLNPNNLVIRPGTIVPVARNAGSQGPSVQPLPRAGDFNVGDNMLMSLQANIRRKLFDETTAPLDRAVRSAEEVRLRREQLAEDIGPSFGRLKSFLTNVVARSVRLMAEQGLLPEFRVDNRQVKLDFVASLTEQQNRRDMESLLAAAQSIEAIYPGMSKMLLKPDRVLAYIVEKTGIPAELAASSREVQVMMQQLAGAVEQGDVPPEALAQRPAPGPTVQ